jgi:hypothetical protein
MELHPPLTDAKPGLLLTPIPLFFACRLSVGMADDRALIFNSLRSRGNETVIKNIEASCHVSLEVKDLPVTPHPFPSRKTPHTFIFIVP